MAGSRTRPKKPEVCNCTSGAGDEWLVYHCELHGAARDLLAGLGWMLEFDMLPDFPNEGDMVAWCEKRDDLRRLVARLDPRPRAAAGPEGTAP